MAVRGGRRVRVFCRGVARDVRTVLEGWAIRRLRSELQELRDERERAKTAATSRWAQESVEEVGQAVKWLDDFYREPTEGFGRPGGLCPGGTLDDRALTTYVVGVFLPARAAGRSVDASLATMRAAVLRSDAYRAVHPSPATSR